MVKKGALAVIRRLVKILFPVILVLSANLAALALSGPTTAFAASQPSQSGQEVIFLPNPTPPPKNQNVLSNSQSLEPSGSETVPYQDWEAFQRQTPEPKENCSPKASGELEIIIGHRFMRMGNPCSNSPVQNNPR